IGPLSPVRAGLGRDWRNPPCGFGLSCGRYESRRCPRYLGRQGRQRRVMPSAEQLFLLVSAMSLAILSPGPAILSAIQVSFARGRGVAVPYGIGLAVGASLWGLFAIL